MVFPDYFCWTRCGAEGGQTIDYIVHRKEQERVANKGLFLWGIGNPLGPSVKELLRRTAAPDVFFSPIKGAARRVDSSPQSVVAWTRAETADGLAWVLPANSLVTSRQDVTAPKETHYALVCFSKTPLEFRATGTQIAADKLRNILTGTPPGASQVTAIVQLGGSTDFRQRLYDVLFRAQLVSPYFIRLRQPTPIARPVNSDATWSDLVQSVWGARGARSAPKAE